jgi:hypothetical protein
VIYNYTIPYFASEADAPSGITKPAPLIDAQPVQEERGSSYGQAIAFINWPAGAGPGRN